MSQDQPQNTTAYVHPRDPNLNRLESAMEYSDGVQPHLRVSLGSDTITINGDVNLVDSVRVNNTEEQSIPVHLTDDPIAVTQSGTWNVGIGTDGQVTLKAGSAVIGKVDVNNWPATQPVSIATMPTTPVTGTFWQATQPVSGTVTVQDGGNTITVDGTVNANVTFPDIQKVSKDANANSTTNPIYVNITNTELEIKNDLNNPIPISKNLLPNSSANPINVNLIGSGEASGVSSSIDSKGRLKVQTQESIFFNTFQYNKETDVWDESTVNGGSAVFNASQGLVDMSVTSTLGSKVVRQTRQVMRYTSGRQNTLTFSVRLEMPVVGVRRRFGLFDGSDGFYFEDSGTLDANGLPEYAVVLTSTASGSLVKERITRDNWNGDKLDGTGPSGITASPLAQQMISVEYEWYGAGQIVFSYIINGLPRVIHIFNTGNRLLFPWSRTPFLPIRLELENFGGAAGTHHLYQGSNSVLVEGRLVKQGIPSNILTPLAGIDLDKAYTFYPVVSVRMKPTTLEGIILLSNFVCNTLDNTDIYYKVLRNATVNGTWVDNPQPNAFTQYNYTSSTTEVTDGVQIDSGFITAGSAVRVELSKDADLQLGRGSMGTVSDIITIAIASKLANKKAVASLSWIEQR